MCIRCWRLSSHYPLPSGSKSDCHCNTEGLYRWVEMLGEICWKLPRAIPEWAVKASDFRTPAPTPTPTLQHTYIPWEIVHAWYSIIETIKVILMRVTALSLETLKNQAQPTSLNKPIKDASNCIRQEKNIYSMWSHWSHWQEGQMPSPLSLAQSIFRLCGTR